MWRYYNLVLSLPVACVLVGSTAQANLLGNPSFELPDASGGDVGGAPGAPWSGFNDPSIRFTTQAISRTGDQSLKMFGPFDFIGGGVGATQKVPAAPGDVFAGEIYAQNASFDAIQGNNFGVYKIEFLDAGMNLLPGGAGISVFESSQINASTPQDQWTQLGVGTAPAPAGTAFAQAVIVQVQLGDGDGNFAGGSIFWDDASLTLVPEPASFALAGLGAVGLVVLYRRRRRA